MEAWNVDIAMSTSRMTLQQRDYDTRFLLKIFNHLINIIKYAK